jgi:hypothetical protein
VGLFQEALAKWSEMMDIDGPKADTMNFHAQIKAGLKASKEKKGQVSKEKKGQATLSKEKKGQASKEKKGQASKEKTGQVINEMGSLAASK